MVSFQYQPHRLVATPGHNILQSNYIHMEEPKNKLRGQKHPTEPSSATGASKKNGTTIRGTILGNHLLRSPRRGTKTHMFESRRDSSNATGVDTNKNTQISSLAKGSREMSTSMRLFSNEGGSEVCDLCWRKNMEVPSWERENISHHYIGGKSSGPSYLWRGNMLVPSLRILAHLVKWWAVGVFSITETKRKVFRFHETSWNHSQFRWARIPTAWRVHVSAWKCQFSSPFHRALVARPLLPTGITKAMAGQEAGQAMLSAEPYIWIQDNLSMEFFGSRKIGGRWYI